MHKGTEHLGSVSFCCLKPDGDICKEGRDPGAEKGKVGEAEFEKGENGNKTKRANWSWQGRRQKKALLHV